MPKRAIFSLNIETGFIVNAPVTNNSACSKYIFSMAVAFQTGSNWEMQLSLVKNIYTSFEAPVLIAVSLVFMTNVT